MARQNAQQRPVAELLCLVELRLVLGEVRQPLLKAPAFEAFATWSDGRQTAPFGAAQTPRNLFAEVVGERHPPGQRS